MSLLYLSILEDGLVSECVPPCRIAVNLLCYADNQTWVLQMVQNYVAGDSMACCCLGMCHPLKAPRTPQSNEQ